MNKRNKRIQGSITPALLVITGAFLTIIYGLIFLLVLQLDFSNRQSASEEALSLSEAGINYYRWHLAHDPVDYTDATTSAAPYIHSVTDPAGGVIGTYSLTITPPASGSGVVTITSVGTLTKEPNIQRKIVAQYGRQSLAKYSFLSNASSWYGSGITVNGDIHSNTGIRMDGTNTAKVTSAQTTYTCGSETGCSPSQSKAGVWGAGGDQTLWQFPVPSIDFNAISFDFSQMKTAAQTSGLYLAPSTRQGYHITFASNGDYNVKRVNTTTYLNGYDAETGCQRLYQVISSETNIGTYQIATKPIIFVEDNLWVEGTMKGKATVVAARFPIATSTADIWIRNNLQYVAYDGLNRLGLIAQRDIYFARDIPTNFIVDGALMAQKGKIIRHGYLSSCGSTTNAIRNSLTINGAIISYNKSYWNFNSPPISGFTTRSINYDAKLLYEPPPYFPVSGDYEFVSWKEQ
ncbi:hypothetical protein KBA63_05030 [Candidatus Woesebacteria bacterium]|nr:hypothetical protein [Candidatus Woesebacteria bacterium]MBP9687128.1 hypothetical protein [Candidatus Woesebacteria bacterium]